MSEKQKKEEILNDLYKEDFEETKEGDIEDNSGSFED
jgi:hypothetical protein